MKSNQVKYYNEITQNNKRFSKKIKFSLYDEDVDASVELVKLTCKEKIVQHFTTLRKKISIKTFLYPLIVAMLLAITGTTIYSGIKMSSTSNSTVLKSNKSYKELFNQSSTSSLIQRDLDKIDHTDLLRGITNWTDENKISLQFIKQNIDRNFIDLISPSIIKLVGIHNYINVKYKLNNPQELIADIRWCKEENGKLVGNVYYDSIEITL